MAINAFSSKTIDEMKTLQLAVKNCKKKPHDKIMWFFGNLTARRTSLREAWQLQDY